MEMLPDEIIFEIGYMLTTWNDLVIHDGIQKRRKDLKYAHFARTWFEFYRTFRGRFGVRWGDDRCRHWDPFSFLDDKYDFQTEHWLTQHPWIDYNCNYTSGECSEYQWCYTIGITVHGWWSSLKSMAYFAEISGVENQISRCGSGISPVFWVQVWNSRV